MTLRTVVLTTKSTFYMKSIVISEKKAYLCSRIAKTGFSATAEMKREPGENPGQTRLL